MITDARMVPVTATDLISLYGFALCVAAAAASGTEPEALDATDIATFNVSTNSKTYIAAEPVKALTFGSSITACTLYFVPAIDFAGFAKTDATLTVTGDVVADGKTLYKATLSTNALTIVKVGF
jgi:hypothetical protein